MEFHEAADIFPLDEEHLNELAESIRRRGLEVPIEVYEGKVLDGRRRYLACQKVGVAPQFRGVTPDDPVDYVFALNFHRRHLSPTQKSMAAAKAEKLRAKYAAEAKGRMRAGGGDRKSPRAKSGPVNLPDPIKGDTRDHVGEKFGVSGKSVDMARTVLEKATPALIAAVEADRVAVSTAARAASLSHAEQDALAERARESAKKGGRPRPRPVDGAHRKNGVGPTDEERERARRARSKGLDLAVEAVNCLSRIPKNDPFRERGFQIVTDWIRRERKG